MAYADDIVLLTENRAALKDMMRSMRIFVKEKELILNAEKAKFYLCMEGVEGRKSKVGHGKVKL